MPSIYSMFSSRHRIEFLWFYDVPFVPSGRGAASRPRNAFFGGAHTIPPPSANCKLIQVSFFEFLRPMQMSAAAATPTLIGGGSCQNTWNCRRQVADGNWRKVNQLRRCVDWLAWSKNLGSVDGDTFLRVYKIWHQLGVVVTSDKHTGRSWYACFCVTKLKTCEFGCFFGVVLLRRKTTGCHTVR